MMGKKNLAEIKRELRKLISGDEQAIREWVEQSSKSTAGSKLEEDLLWVRDLLQNTVKKKGSESSRKRQSKNTSEV